MIAICNKHCPIRANGDISGTNISRIGKHANISFYFTRLYVPYSYVITFTFAVKPNDSFTVLSKYQWVSWRGIYIINFQFSQFSKFFMLRRSCAEVLAIPALVIFMMSTLLQKHKVLIMAFFIKRFQLLRRIGEQLKR